MKIIPVIDIKNGQVVRAVKGERSAYRPVKSKLCTSSNPVDVVSAFIKIISAETIYIADLDSLENNGNNYATINHLIKKFPDQTFWVDAGFHSQKQINHWKRIPRLIPVIGTESHSDLISITPLLDDKIILSLDFKNNQLLGPGELLKFSALWPEKVIIMMLDVLGSDTGPDLLLIDQIQKLKPQTHFFAAGGIRNDTDIEKLITKQITGVLIASALHDQQLNITR